jgi:glucose 1-dehydrogenase
MKAIALRPGTSELRLVDRPEPAIQADDEIKARVLAAGICGTDREEASGGRAKAPAGQADMVIGHEMLCQVMEVGKGVSRVRPGDLAVFTVRRGCGHCLPCAMNRSDMCETGDYTERGIWGRDGYQAELVVDKEPYIVRVPPELEQSGVLIEPLSVVEKAIGEAAGIQMHRLPDAAETPNWLHGRRCLVAGLGPVGLLAAVVLRLAGAEVYGLDIVDAGSARPQWLAGIGGQYIDGRKVKPDQMDDRVGEMDMIVEAAGVAPLEFSLIDALGVNGIYVLTGVPGGSASIQIPGAELIRQLVLHNQALLGSVNAARGHFQLAVDDLLAAHLRWGGQMQKLITHRVPYTGFDAVLHEHQPDEIKVVLEWAQAGGGK